VDQALSYCQPLLELQVNVNLSVPIIAKQPRLENHILQ
jgi:hypothetical protein